MADVSLHSVPLEDIIFDTFGGSPRFVPLSRASEELIRDLRDAIAPMANPVYGGPDSLPWLAALVGKYSPGHGLPVRRFGLRLSDQHPQSS